MVGNEQLDSILSKALRKQEVALEHQAAAELTWCQHHSALTEWYEQSGALSAVCKVLANQPDGIKLEAHVWDKSTKTYKTKDITLGAPFFNLVEGVVQTRIKLFRSLGAVLVAESVKVSIDSMNNWHLELVLIIFPTCCCRCSSSNNRCN